MQITMTTTERVWPNGYDAEPTYYRRGQEYEAPEAIAAALIADGKATSNEPAPEPKPATKRRK